MRRTPPPALVIHPDDNVAVALRDLTRGESVSLIVGGRPRHLAIREPIPANHKVALQPIRRGAGIVKYGEVMGEATRAIPAGSHVHIHNVVSRRVRPGKR
jgi:altronate dehydratase small subunit